MRDRGRPVEADTSSGVRPPWWRRPDATITSAVAAIALGLIVIVAALAVLR
jgi:hypothetical protein